MPEQIPANFKPITITAETLQLLAKQPGYATLLTLYMAYVEIASWQDTTTILATASFMANRLKKQRNTISKYNQQLKDLGLIETVRQRDENNKITGHFVKINYIVNIAKAIVPIDDTMAKRYTSTIDLQLSAVNSKLKKKKNKTKKEKPDPKSLLLLVVNSILNRQFRVLPSRGVKQLLDSFTMAEIELALTALAANDWHAERLPKLNLDYLIRPTTIQQFLETAQHDGTTPKRTLENMNDDEISDAQADFYQREHEERESLRQVREGGTGGSQ